MRVKKDYWDKNFCKEVTLDLVKYIEKSRSFKVAYASLVLHILEVQNLKTSFI